MSLGNLPDNKLMSLALQGYNPFQPDVGIFSGGYQGILYPNPTTIAYPNFDSYAYTDPTISSYTPAANYNGLGIGNPGIDYKNGGHILGLLDTFARMSYGIACWLSIIAGENTPGIPSVNITLPLKNFEWENSPIGMSDIYPAYSEVPSDWINGFEVSANGKVTPDPRNTGGFPTPGGGHTPTTTIIDAEALNILFGNKLIFSYLGMPQYFRTVIEDLANAAYGLTEKAELEFTLTDHADYFNNYSHQVFYHSQPPDSHYGFNSAGTLYAQCAVVSPTVALKILNGTTEYHNGTDGQNEYRSLTELNSVINLIPLQMVGATFWTDTKGYRETIDGEGGITYEIDDQTGRTISVASIMIADFVINISDIPPDPEDPEPGTVTIAGTATVHSLITDPTAMYFTETRRYLPSPINSPDPGPIVTIIWGNSQHVKKEISIDISATNNFTWDKAWLGGEEINDSEHFPEDSSDGYDNQTTINGGSSEVGYELLDQSDLEVTFSKEITLGAGCTSIRLRAFMKNRGYIGQLPFTSEDLWVPIEYCHEHGFIIFQPGYHCHYPIGVHYNGYVGDPDGIVEAFASPNMELSLTVTGTNMDTLELNVSL